MSARSGHDVRIVCNQLPGSRRGLHKGRSRWLGRMTFGALSDWNCTGTMESHQDLPQIGSLCGARNFAVANLPMSHKILHGSKTLPYILSVQ